MSQQQTYIYMIRATRQDFSPEAMTPLEQQLMGEHWVYLKQLFAEGQVILAGPATDGAFGIVIFEAGSLEDARQIAANDPAVKGGIMGVELHQYRVSLLRQAPAR
ncbi:MAG TPA: YciI family protein [Ktedonobacterales bacterium]|jgi:uncharacterized protein YciI